MPAIAIVGAGVVGMSTAYALTNRPGEPVDVTVFDPGIVLGRRSAGDSRIMRHAHSFPDLATMTAGAAAEFGRWSQRYGAALVGDEGVVISNQRIDETAAALSAAGLAYDISSGRCESLPGQPFLDRFLFDPGGGVIRVDRVRDFLVRTCGHLVTGARVDRIEGATVVADGRSCRFDAVLVAAGEHTPDLAEPLGMSMTRDLHRHFRFAFAGQQPVTGHSGWIDTDQGFSTYQLFDPAGFWTIGGHFEADEVGWAVPEPTAAATSLARIQRYIADRGIPLDPEPVSRVDCSTSPGLGDGYGVARSGSVLAVAGENLFKLAPALGNKLAEALLDGSTPASTGTATALFG